MRRALRAAAAAGVLAAAAIATAIVTSPAHADTQICDQFGSTTIQGRYVVQNNRWGTSAQQCINVTSTGFTITTQQGSNPTNGGPVSYPSVYYGCHYTNCSPGTNLPMQLSRISSVTSSINYQYVSNAIYDASYDIWLDPTPKTDGVNQQEVMIWFNRVGSVQPVGSVVGNATIGGRTWQVWQGSNGSNNVISYVAPSAISSWSFSVLDFLNDVRSRSSVTTAWYLTSIQAGFEPWQGGTGLGVTSFSATVNGGPPPTTPPNSPPPTSPPPGNAACKVTYKTNTWNTGFTADVTVANTGNSAINGWTLTWSFPGNQHVTSAWNATVSQSGSAATARNMSYNGSVPAGGSTSFGFQATYSGSNGNPSAFALNGTACAVG
jgi:glycosyl hydrolase family 12/cellulose binding protein with CBM2 domain